MVAKERLFEFQKVLLQWCSCLLEIVMKGMSKHSMEVALVWRDYHYHVLVSGVCYYLLSAAVQVIFIDI